MSASPRRALAVSLALLAAGGAAVAVYVTRPEQPERVVVAPSPEVREVLVPGADGALTVDGTARHADGCEVRVYSAPPGPGTATAAAATIADGRFAITVPGDALGETVGPRLVWIETACDSQRVALHARRFAAPTPTPTPNTEHATAAPSRAVPVVEVAIRTDALIARTEALALDLSNRAVQRAIRDEVRGEEVIALDIPLGRWADAAQRWADRRLTEGVAEDLDALIPDDLGDTRVAVQWGDETSVRLANLDLDIVDPSVVRATFDADIRIHASFRADPPPRRGGQGWTPDPLHVRLARISATFDLSDFPHVRARRVDLLGDLCERPEGRFWRRSCAAIAPRLVSLVERPVLRALDERAMSWGEAIAADRTLFELAARFGAPAASVGEWEELIGAAEPTLAIARLDDERVVLRVEVDPDWLGDAGLGGVAVHGSADAAPQAPQETSDEEPLRADVEVRLAVSVVNRALRTVFDRPLAEVADAAADALEPIDEARAAALRGALTEAGATLDRAATAWADALALANLAPDRTFRVVPELSLRTVDGETDAVPVLLVHDARPYRGVDVPAVGLSLSFALPVRFVPEGLVFRLAPDWPALARAVALEALGPESTTRADVRRFGVFVATQLERSFAAEGEPPMVDVRPAFDGLEALLPRVPRAASIGPVAFTLDSLGGDAERAALVVRGTVVVAEPER